MRRGGAMLGMALALAGCASTRDFAAPGHRLAQGAVIAVPRPDVEVGRLGPGGVAEPDADATAAARRALGTALVAQQAAHGNDVRLLADPPADRARLVAEYEALNRTVAGAIAAYKYGQTPLPTKKRRFDWTLGPGVRGVANGEGATHLLFLTTRDHFSTDTRKAVAVAGLLGCAVGLCLLPGGGEHLAYASLVELSTGDIVWFNVLSGAAGDVRTPEGARETVERLLASMPGPKR